jgi:E3 ubiquitin-protein ligase MYCBP2
LLQTTKEDIKEEEEEEEAPPSLVEGNIPQKEPSPFVEVPVIKRQALSPAVAECQRAVFAAFLWQEGLVHDSMASAVYLKFNPNTPSKMDVVSLEGDLEENGQKESLPSTLNHLITFWDEISQKVVENSASFFTIPRVPSFAQELQKRYDEEKKEMERVKKEKEKKSGGGGALAVAGAGSTMCELCESHFPDPVTYHMKDSHPGCGKHANGWGYNSRGSYCSGWAGNCGDGGRGGSTWYLMCKDCHTKYVSMKEENKRVVVKPVSVPKMKTRKPGKARVLPIVSSVQGMTSNAKFLLEVTSYSDGGKRKSTTSVVTSQSDISRQLSTPDDVKERTASLTRSQDKSTENQSPVPTFQSGPLNSFVRSISISASDNNNESFKRTLSESGDADSVPVALTRQMTVTTPTSQTEPSASLVNKPSMSLAKLMYNRSCQSKDNGYSRVMNFVTQYHDLDGLKATMKQMMRLAYLKSFALKFLQWLLHESTDPTVIHDILWQFMSSVSDHPMVQSSHRTKSENDDKKDDKENKIDWELGKNPLTGLEGAGTALIDLRAVFHSFLLTIGTKISQLPVGSIAQQMALKCWCLEFQAQDHSFLLQSRVFANISEALSNMEEVEGDSSQISNRDDMGVIETMCNVLMDGKLKVSSNDAMSNSLNDGSTETFWESRDEPRGKPRSITVTFEKKRRLFGASIHIDNTKDSAQSIESVALHVGSDEDCLKEVDKCKLLSSHVGWKTLIIPEDYKDSLIIRFELRGNQNNIRVRQIMVLGLPDKPIICPFTSIAMQKDCETEALRLFRLLTAQVSNTTLSFGIHY